MDDFGKPDTYTFEPDISLRSKTDEELQTYENRLRDHFGRLEIAISDAEDPRKIERARELLPMLNDELRRVRDLFWERNPIDLNTYGDKGGGVWID